MILNRQILFGQRILFVAAALFFVNASFAFAHEREVINVGGTDYLFVVGSLNEPVVVGDKTGIDLRVYIPDPKDIGNSSATNTKPVLGLEKTLKIENISGSKSKEFPLEASWGKEGSYQTVFYPSSADDFSYRIFGTIGGKNIDITFTCNEAGHVMAAMTTDTMQMNNGNFPVKFQAGSFGCPKDKAEYMFPSSTTSWTSIIMNNNLFGIIALVLVLGFIVQNKKTRK
ncbi:MAG: uncharacterized protein JWO50_651 [Candidatus Kaiserbacteria bacterium]|nr:uncharacterized protein [Candidatus Kaiserbacteria bacterium]